MRTTTRFRFVVATLAPLSNFRTQIGRVEALSLGRGKFSTMSNFLQTSGELLSQQRPAQSYTILSEAIDAAKRADDAFEEETALRLRNFCAWLMGDWTDMPTIIQNYRRARELQVLREQQQPSDARMMAAICPATGGLELSKIPVPEPLAGFVKIRVRAFGLNRTEKFLVDSKHAFGWPVKELSPVSPMVNGIECVGEVVASGPPLGKEAELPVGTRVLACACSLGRGIDGTHAEYVVVPRWGVVPVPPAGEALSWRQLAALPLSYGTAAGSLDAMDCRENDSVLIRGGTSALGLAAISLAKHTMKCTVVATSRRASSKELLLTTGADVVLVEPNIREQIRSLYPDGVDCALECIGEATLKDTLHCVRPKGVVCQTGALSHDPDFNLHVLGEVPSSVKVTCFESDGLTAAVMTPLMDKLVRAIKEGSLQIPLDPTEFKLSQYKEAFAFLDSKERKGKIVIEVD